MKVVVGQGGGVFEPEFGGAVQPFTQTMTNLLESDIIARRVTGKLHPDQTPAEFLTDLHVSSRPESSVLEVSYEDTDKKRAVRALAEVGTVFIALIDERLSARLRRDSLPAVTVAIFDPAHLEAEPVSPKPVRSLGFATALGLVIGLVLAFARDSVDDRIRSRSDAERAFGAPVAGALPRGMRGATPLLVGGRGGGTGEEIEALLLLRANLMFSEAGIQGRTVAVTSGLSSEGTTTVVANLAVLLALAGHDVICVDADLRRPRLHELLNLSSEGAGLNDIAEGRIAVADALRDVDLGVATTDGAPVTQAALRIRPRATAAAGRRQTPAAGAKAAQKAEIRSHPRLRVLLANPSPDAPAVLLTANRVAKLVEQLSTHAEYVIFDTPPILEVGDAFPFAKAADTVLVVAREGRTTVSTAEAIRLTLDGLGVSKVSIILTGSNTRGGSRGYNWGADARRDSLFET